jgi:TonB family protein
VTFSGTGTDPEEGKLSGAALLWTSDLDGELGTGESLTTSDLSIGVHTITLTVVDSDGGIDVHPITVPITNSRPTATIVGPGDGSSFPAGTPVTFVGTGTDPEDGELRDASLVWTSDLDGELGTGESVTTSGLSIGVHTITLSVADSNGGTDEHPITLPITNNRPTAAITAPPAGASFPVGTPVTFAGTGTDPEDGSLSEGSMVWTSDLDGELGTGESLTTADLSIGVHTITLTVEDSHGSTNIYPITVPIVDNPPPPPAPESDPAPQDVADPSEESDEVRELRALGPSYIPYDQGPETIWNTDTQAMLTRTLLPVLREHGLSARTRAMYWVLIREDGTAAEVIVQTSSGTEAFDQAGIEVIRRLEFLPAFRANRPVPTWVVREISLLMQ